jgi:hypothetical protein
MIKVLHIYPKNDPLTTRYVHLLMDKIESKATDNAVEFKSICQQWQPDIIHQHGSVDVKYQSNFRWIVSPNGLVSSFDDYYAVIARSPLEAENLHKAGSKRVEIIKNPLITKQVDFEETAGKMRHVYEKVMNSNPLDLMDDDAKQALAVILKAAICGDKRWVEQYLPVSTSQMRLLYIYASLEGVLPLLDEGLKLIGMEQPKQEPFECYLPEDYTVPTSMSASSILNMLVDIQHNGLSLRRLADIFSALYADTHNDDKLIGTLDDNNLKPMFASILKILQEQLLLDDGYMPCPVIDNSATNHLRKSLQNHLSL